MESLLSGILFGLSLLIVGSLFRNTPIWLLPPCNWVLWFPSPALLDSGCGHTWLVWASRTIANTTHQTLPSCSPCVCGFLSCYSFKHEEPCKEGRTIKSCVMKNTAQLFVSSGQQRAHCETGRGGPADDTAANPHASSWQTQRWTLGEQPGRPWPGETFSQSAEFGLQYIRVVWSQ